jgi:hypothetical protein
MAKPPTAAPNPPPSREALATFEGLRDWLLTQPKAVSVAIAARAALRLLPLYGRFNPGDPRRYADLTVALFRACAFARAAAKYQARANDRRTAAADAAAAAARTAADDAARTAAAAAAYAARTAAAADAAAYAARTVAAADAADAADAAAADARLLATGAIDLSTLLASPLWPETTPPALPDALRDDWAKLRARLPREDDWQIWIDWYEGLLRGGARDEAYETVFADVPEAEWKKGAKAANAWIRDHLPKPPESKSPDPGPLEQRAAPFAFTLRDGRLAVAPETAQPRDAEAAADFLAESRRKAADLGARIANAQHDDAVHLRTALELLEAHLAAEPLRIGLLLSSLISLEADAQVYNSDAGRKEHALDLIAQVTDLATTVRHAVSEYPRARAIRARLVELDFAGRPGAAKAALKLSEGVAETAAAHAELVEPEVPGVLREPAKSIAAARKNEERDEQIGFMFLTALDFLTAAVQAAKRARPRVKIAPGLGGAGALALWSGPSAHAMLGDLGGHLAGAGAQLGLAAYGIAHLIKEINKFLNDQKKRDTPPKAGGNGPKKPAGRDPKKPAAPGKPKAATKSWPQTPSN